MTNRIIQLILGAFLFVSSVNTAIAQTLTEASIKSLFANQPDYQANYTVTRGKESIKFRLAKKGHRFRHDLMPIQNAAPSVNEQYRFYKIITLTTPGRPVLALDPQEQTYSEMPESEKFPTPDFLPYFEAALKRARRVSAIGLGPQVVDGHKTRRLRISFEVGAEEEDAIIYVATDLKELIVRMDAADKNGPMSFSMSDISLQVPDELFDVPVSYKQVGFDSFLSAMKKKILK